MIRHFKSPFREKTGITKIQFLVYIVKAFVAVTLVLPCLWFFPQYSEFFYWALISILLSITHDNTSEAAISRMKGNTVGPLVGFGCYFVQLSLHQYLSVPKAKILAVGLGVMLTITICTYLRLITICRTALVGFFIVMIYEYNNQGPMGAFLRLTGVITGCILGLFINKIFLWLQRGTKRVVQTTIEQVNDMIKKDDAK